MEKEKDATKLIRLKRYEQPSADYFDGFLKEFHRRQRSELLKRSSFSLFAERLSTYLADPGEQKWAYAPVLAVFALAFHAILVTTVDSKLPALPAVTADWGQPDPGMKIADNLRGDLIEVDWTPPRSAFEDEPAVFEDIQLVSEPLFH